MALAVLGCRLLLLKCDLFFSLFNKESARAGPSLAGRGTRLGKTLLCRGLRSLALPAGAVSAASRAPATATRTHARTQSQPARAPRAAPRPPAVSGESSPVPGWAPGLPGALVKTQFARKKAESPPRFGQSEKPGTSRPLGGGGEGDRESVCVGEAVCAF